MKTMHAILGRRSIRKYTDQVVTDDTVKEIVKAGMYAPSAGNGQPWEFIVVRNRETLCKITEVHPYSSMLKEAGVAVVICGNLKKEKYKDFWVQDCSAAAQNILLAVHALGLGAVWLGIYPEKDRVNGVKEILQLPEDIIPLAIIPVGYPAEDNKNADRYNESCIHYEQW